MGFKLKKNFKGVEREWYFNARFSGGDIKFSGKGFEKWSRKATIYMLSEKNGDIFDKINIDITASSDKELISTYKDLYKYIEEMEEFKNSVPY